MKSKYLFFVLIVLIASLIAVSCKTSGDVDDPDDSKLPNFAVDSCPGCPTQENIGSVTGLRFFSYVKNNGGDGKISMTIGAGTNTTTKEFSVKAGIRYVFQASVPVEKSSTTTFTYLAKFPGTPGYTDSHTVTGYHVTGAPFDLQLNPK